MQHLYIRLLGRPEVLLDGQPVKFPTRKALALLAYLVATEETASREKLMVLLWPNSATPSAQASLRNALARLKTALGSHAAMVVASADAIGIDPAANFDLDLSAVSAAVSAARDTSHPPSPALLQPAVDLYRDEFLSQFILVYAPDFNHWALVERERWHRSLTLVLDRLTQHHLRHLTLPAAIATARRWLQHDRLDETGCRTLMQAYALAGDRSAALQVYDSSVAVLAIEMELTPEPATKQLAETIRRAVSDVSRQTRPAAALAAPQPSLPLVGRADEYASLVAAYAGAADGGLRVVVISGEAGMGKTRLVNEFLAWVALQGGDVLRGRAFESGGQLPFQPLVMALRGRWVAEALDGLNDRALRQANKPYRVYLTLFRVLRVCGDGRADDILTSAHRLMQKRAAAMPDEASRQAFWQNVPAKRALLHEFEKSRAATLILEVV